MMIIDKLNDSEDVRLPHDKEIVAFDLDLCTGIFAIQNSVTDLHSHRLVLFTRTCGDNRAALRLFFGCVGNDNATGSFFFSWSWLHYYPISKRGNVSLFANSRLILLVLFEKVPARPDGEGRRILYQTLKAGHFYRFVKISGNPT